MTLSRDPSGRDAVPVPVPVPGFVAGSPVPRPRPKLAVVAIGASAGGLDPVERLFANLPSPTGAAFVLIQHLSPKHRSYMDDIMRRRTAMPVRVVADGQRIEPDTLYLLPPGHVMTYAHGALRLARQQPGHVGPLPIDTFFRSLAAADDVQPILVVLSGTGSDGTAGLVQAKRSGAFAIVQDEQSAQFAGMPGSAIATGLVDQVCLPEEIGLLIAERLRTPDARDAELAATPQLLDAMLRRIEQVHGIDFRPYKPGTVVRRVTRRMQLARAPDPQAYLAQLEADPAEVDALLDDLLINVTEFFRDPQGFATLEQKVLREAVAAAAGAGRPLRFWVVGCATGEEAYTLAMLALDAIRATDARVDLRIFATDLHAPSIAVATQGRYSAERMARVPAHLLDEYWVETDGGYVARQALREVVTFARHDVLQDAPFTQLDLVTCRNLLIYLDLPAQRIALSMFAFGLKAGGCLMLGASEGIAENDAMFRTIDERHRLFRRESAVDGAGLLEPPRPKRPERNDAALGAVAPARSRTVKGALLEAHDEILERYAPPSLLVDTERRVVEILGGAERHLQFQRGRLTTDLMDVLDVRLRGSVAAALRRLAREPGRLAVHFTASLGDSPESALDVTVETLLTRRTRTRYYLLTFRPRDRDDGAGGADAACGPDGTEGQDGADGHAAAAVDGAGDDVVARLRAELEEARAFSQETAQELEIGAEELQTANEELMATNEELQASNEELSSVNEEMHTINSEYQKKIEELRALNRDMDVLLTSTDIGTLFLEGDSLRIRRFTPFVGSLFSLDAQDVGRDLETFQSRLLVPDLPELARQVLRDGATVDREVRDRQRNTYLMRIVPNRGGGAGTAAGVVLTLININQTAEALSALQRSERDLQELVDALPVLIATVDADGRCRTINRRMRDAFGCAALDGQRPPLRDCVGEADHAAIAPHLAQALAGEEVQFEQPLQGAGNGVYLVRLVPRRRDDVVVGLVMVAMDVSEMKEAERALARAREVAEAANRAKSEFLANMSHEIRTPMTAVLGYADILAAHVSDADDRSAVRAIQRNGMHLLDIINDILDLSKIEAGRVDVAPVAADVAGLLGDAFGMLEARASDKRLTYTLGHHGMIPRTVQTDPLRVRQILLNLIGNAIKFTAAGAVELSARLLTGTLDGARFDAHPEGAAFLAFSVSDTGPGIAPEQLAHLFEPFGQTDSASNRHHEGTGLGLAISQRLAGQLGGLVRVARTDSTGSVFELLLPVTSREREALVTPQLHSQEPEAQAPTRLPSLQGRPRILVVDDRRDVRLLVQHLLEEAGARIEAAAGGREAIDLVRQADGTAGRFDAVVIDMQMPDVDGYTATRTLREGGFDRPIVALTAGAMKGDAERCFAAGCSGYLPKPVNPGELVRTLERLMNHGAPDPGADGAAVTPSRGRVLLVEDSEDAAGALATLLELHGFRVEVSHDGREAMRRARLTGPDVVLLDLGLPDVDGATVAARLREFPQTRTARIIAFTGRDLSLEEARRAGFDAVLRKPAQIAALVALLAPLPAAADGPAGSS